MNKEPLPYLSRDISWLSFNRRVSDEMYKNIPLGDKVMFQGITYSNLSEFMMVRYPACIEFNTDTELEELTSAISVQYNELSDRFRKFNKKKRIIRPITSLMKEERKWADRYFEQNVYPGLQAITFDRTKDLNLHSGIYVLVMYERNDEPMAGYIEIPPGINRFIAIPGKNFAVAVEDMIKINIKKIFLDSSNYTVAPFVIARSAEVYVQSDRYTDPFQLISETLREREKSWVTYLEVGSDKKSVLKLLRKVLPMSTNTITFISNMVHLQDLKSFPTDVYDIEQKSRRYEPIATFPATGIFNYIRKQDRLCFHPYESYRASMVRLLEEAAIDPDVVSIKISLYRVSDNSRIIDALLKAADKGKLVTVLIELKARFDEHHNMEISTILREGGVRLVYTKPDIKTHAKVCLITRKEKKGLRIYSQIGTGNYSEANAKLYSDYSYFSADQELGRDLTQFFNLLTSDQGTFKSRKIIYAPYNMREEITERINEQIKRAKNKKSARIIMKCNALTDDKIADKLIEAAKSGVDITLIIRSACIVEPMENIKIYSIVGRFLEHSRVFVFGSGKESKVYIGSADAMRRNLSMRNELLLLVEKEDIRNRIMKHINMYLKDTVNRRVILNGYKYEDVKQKRDKKPFNSHSEFIKEAKKLAL